jgi:hypothetical protein
MCFLTSSCLHSRHLVVGMTLNLSSTFYLRAHNKPAAAWCDLKIWLLLLRILLRCLTRVSLLIMKLRHRYPLWDHLSGSICIGCVSIVVWSNTSCSRLSKSDKLRGPIRVIHNAPSRVWLREGLGRGLVLNRLLLLTLRSMETRGMVSSEVMRVLAWKDAIWKLRVSLVTLIRVHAVGNLTLINQICIILINRLVPKRPKSTWIVLEASCINHTIWERW